MDFAMLRADMVDSLEHETKNAISSSKVAKALRSVPRHEFVDEGHRSYLDKAFTHKGTRILAPSTVARLIEALKINKNDSVLIVGAGVGYTAAVAAEIAGGRHVHAIDITRQMVLEARENLAAAGYRDVLVDCKDGANGLPRYAPYDRILIEAAVSDPPQSLLGQLADEGRLVMPEGSVDQTLVAYVDGHLIEDFGPVAFDPLLVEGEEHGAIERNRTAREDRERKAREAQSRGGWEHNWINWDER
ncbi:MAG: protein-L-isoaspartate O-methyltransferase [Halobacteriaceae archaeon]